MTPPIGRDDMHPHMQEDVLETRLRRALNAEATMVNPTGDGLGRIRAGIDEQRYDVWWRRPAVALVAAAVAGLAIGGVAVALGQNEDDPGNVVAEQPTDEPETSAPPTDEPTSQPPSPTSTPSGSTSTGRNPGPMNVPVYYVHDDGTELRLYREFHQVSGGASAGALAVQEMLSEPARDPDYSSPWPPSTRILKYNVSGDTATVDLSAFTSVGSDAETKAVQQLVYTVTAADKSVKRVRLLVNGKTPQSGVSDWSDPVARAPMLDVQGLIWILQPTQGGKAGSPAKVTVYGTAYEGNVIIKVFSGDAEVDMTFVTTAMGEFREASTTFTLDPGTYTVRAYDGNGENGELTERDSKDFTVQ